MIAIVDDDESVRKAVIRLLQAAGHRARGYASAREFLEIWRVDSVDFTILWPIISTNCHSIPLADYKVSD